MLDLPEIRQGLIVEDLPETAQMLRDLLAQVFPGIDVTCVGDLRAARRWLETYGRRVGPPCLALIDLGLPDGSGVELIREIGGAAREIVPIVASVYDDDAHVFEAIAAGAQGYLLKHEDRDALAWRLAQIAAGAPPLSPSIARRMLEHFQKMRPTEPLAALTARQEEVLGLIGRGLTVGQVARELGLTRHTIGGYVKDLYRRLNIGSRAEAALEAERRGLLG